MKQLFFQKGQPRIVEIPPPLAGAKGVVVDVHYSSVSPGTEGALLSSSGRSFLSLALEKRNRVDRLAEAVRRRDFSDVRRRFQRLADRPQALHAPGYSAAGVVRAVGPEVTAFAPGDRVAMAGAGYAVHAEQAVVPANLVVAVPSELDLAPASTVALGAIALQAVRRSEARIGETLLVLGLGFLGQLTARILLAAGCRVLGWDPLESRRKLAARHGVELLPVDALEQIEAAARAATQGHGVDAAILAAAGGAALPEQAARAIRGGGTLVLLGNTPVTVERDTSYPRELTIRMSTSYGPGRYHPRYEEEGVDYPFSQVRWTENRNMAAWLDLLSSGRVTVDDLLGPIRTLEEAAEAYVTLRSDPNAPPGFLFRHGAAGVPQSASAVPSPETSAGGVPQPAARVRPPGFREASGGVSAGPRSSDAAPADSIAARRHPPRRAPLRVALLGTGAYAATGILPPLSALGERIRFELLAGRVPSRREPLAERYGFARTSSDYDVSAVDPGVDLVVIATRHDRHAALVKLALSAGHAVFCEKPLALLDSDLDAIEAELAARRGFLAVGFNRRFAPAVSRWREELAGRCGPLQISYRVQAGPLPEEHWIRGPEGGGRLIGEAVHMIDLLRFVIGAPVQSAWILPGGGGTGPAADEFQAGFRYEDGSTATLLYTGRGSIAHPKERIESHGDGRSFELVNFSRLAESGRSGALYTAPEPRKGAPELWQACAAALLEGGPEPTPSEEVIETHRVAFALERQRRGVVSPVAMRLDSRITGADSRP